MSRYIDADPFEREMYHEAFETDTDMQRWDSGCWIRYKLFETVLDKQPTADVRENVHGEWIKRTYKGTSFVESVCSNCGKTYSLYPLLGYNFCPNCGADMQTNNAPLADDNSIYG